MIIEKIFEKAHKLCNSSLQRQASKTKMLSKKLLAAIVSGLVLLAGVPLTTWAETTFNVTANGIQWTCKVLQENDTDTTNVAIAPADRYSISGEVTIPGTVQNGGTTYTVTTIGEFAFNGCSNLTSVVIPNGVTVIGNYAFEYCSHLTSVTIPDSVTVIGNYAFNGCSYLTSVTIPNSVKKIDYQAFQYCYALKRVNSNKDGECIIPEGMEEIGDLAFYYKNQLETVKIPSSVIAIGDCPFACNEKLTSITVDPNNPNYKDIDGVLFIKDGKTLLQYPIGKSQTSYEIPNGVTTIDKQAFRGCSNLESITIPESVTTIGDQAFDNCSSLESITIPESVTAIGDQAFDNCSSLESITIPESVTAIGASAFSGCSNLKSITILGSIEDVIHDSGRGYCDYVFEGCDNVTSVIIGNVDITLPEGLFEKFPNLNSITIPCNFDKSKFEGTGINVEGDNFALASGSYSSDSDVGEIQEMPGTFTYIHDFEIDSVAKEVTDTTPGALKCVCSVCGAVKEEEVPTLSERKAKELTQTVEMNGQEVNAILQDPYKVLPDGAYMTATLVKPGTDRYNELVSQLDNTHIPENMAFFEIELYHADGTKFKESEMPLARQVRVLLQIPEGWDKEDMEAVLIASGADVEFEENIVTLDGVDYVAFWTDHFSPYAMIDKLNDEEAAELAAQNANAVKTGESIGNCMIFGEVLILASAMLWIAIKKKKDLE